MQRDLNAEIEMGFTEPRPSGAERGTHDKKILPLGVSRPTMPLIYENRQHMHAAM